MEKVFGIKIIIEKQKTFLDRKTISTKKELELNFIRIFLFKNIFEVCIKSITILPFDQYIYVIFINKI